MSSPSLSDDVLDELAEKHIAFLEARLVSDAARADWLRSFVEGWTWALGLRVGDVVDADALTDGVSKALSEETITKPAAPVMKELHRRTLAALRSACQRLR